MAQTAATTLMRDVTDEEVAFYQENGWVVLRELIPSEARSAELDAVKSAMEQADRRRPTGRSR